MFRRYRWRSIERLEPRHMLSGVGAANDDTVAVDIPDDLVGSPGGHVIAPVNINDAEGVCAAEIHIQYETTWLDADNAAVSPGSVWPNTNTFINAVVDDDAGTIVVWVYGIEYLGPGGGSLVKIDFTIPDDAPVGEQAYLDLESVILNESLITVWPVPEPWPEDTAFPPPPDPPYSTDGLVTIIQVNHSPEGTHNTVTAEEDIPFTFGEADFGFSDPNDNPPDEFLAVQITTLPDKGTLTLDDAPVAEGQFVSLADIIAEKLKFTSALHGNGISYTGFEFKVRDDGGTDNGGLDLDQTPNLMTIDVTPVNDQPTADDQSTNTLEDQSVVITLTGNDVEIPQDDLVVTIVSGPSHGTLTPVAGQSRQYEYTPDPDYNGQDDFEFTLTDNGDPAGSHDNPGDLSSNAATVSIDVTPVNDPPENTTLSGFVYADTNRNYQPGEYEGVPGVFVTLAGEGVHLETWTDDHGWYEFSGLMNGTYTIEERHPFCMIDGGNNIISGVTVDTTQGTAGQNFRELGLKPQYVYNRLYSTSVMPVGSQAWVDLIKRIVKDGEEDAGHKPSSPPIASQQTLQQGSEVIVHGTNGNDAFEFVAADTNAGQHEVTLNGETFLYDAAVVNSVQFDGGLGFDTATLSGSPAADQFHAEAKSASLQGTGYLVEVVNIEKTLTTAGSGSASDKATLADSVFDDVLRADIDYASLSAFYYQHVLHEFDEITAFFSHGGQDKKAVNEAIDYLLTANGPWIEL